MFESVAKMEFPTVSGININMMPIIVGDIGSLPKRLQPYQKIIDACVLPKNSKAYLSISESDIQKGQYQRRSGIHTDGVKKYNWGGGWGGKGIYMASSDGRCQVWNTTTHNVDSHGSVLSKLNCEPNLLKSNTLYWMTDRTPHESLAGLRTQPRQWFRLVADDIFIWWAKHSTPNPLGILPNAFIETCNKF